MAMYLGSKKVAVTNTIEKPASMKALLDAKIKFGNSEVTYFDDIFQYSDTSDVRDMSSMFSNCFRLKSIFLFDTSKVTDMNGMFYGCYNLKTVPLFDTSNVENMGSMFSGCSVLSSVPQFDTSNVNDMNGMFSNCSSLTTVPQFDLFNVIYIDFMFQNCPNLEEIHIININANLDISSSTKFTREALLEIIGNLKAQTSGTKTLTMGSTNLAKLTEADKKVATDKGWVLK